MTQTIETVLVPLEQQVANIRRWNSERGWGLDGAAIDTIDLTPSGHGKSLVVDLVAVYLDDGPELNGVRRTCHELWTVAAAQQPHSWSSDWYWDKWKRRPKPVRLHA